MDGFNAQVTKPAHNGKPTADTLLALVERYAPEDADSGYQTFLNTQRTQFQQVLKTANTSQGNTETTQPFNFPNKAFNESTEQNKKQNLTHSPALWDRVNHRKNHPTGRILTKSFSRWMRHESEVTLDFAQTQHESILATARACKATINNTRSSTTAHKKLRKRSLQQLKAAKYAFITAHEQHVLRFLTQTLANLLVQHQVLDGLSQNNAEEVIGYLLAPKTRRETLKRHALYKRAIQQNIPKNKNPKVRQLALLLLGKVIDHQYDQAEIQNLGDRITWHIEFWSPMLALTAALTAATLAFLMSHTAPIALIITILAYASTISFASALVSLWTIATNAWYKRMPPWARIRDLWLNAVAALIGYFALVAHAFNLYLTEGFLTGDGKWSIMGYNFVSALYFTWLKSIYQRYFRGEEFYANKIYRDYGTYLEHVPENKPSTMYHYKLAVDQSKPEEVNRYFALLQDYRSPWKRLVHWRRHHRGLAKELIDLYRRRIAPEKASDDANNIFELLMKETKPGNDTQPNYDDITTFNTLWNGSHDQPKRLTNGSFARRIRYTLFCRAHEAVSQESPDTSTTTTSEPTT